ncbi:HAD family hydrolase [Marinomonas sp. IMCC 4694]|uniref:HAD family hydrolase n=1 Tax=Marinomonas sp. IMCC 4694 TaxID=2605432 RepID=UPI0011E63269|nr:HAD family hydrolase [Marinomonas sp. IMCC 4694]TYL47850.1 HAD family hydrolase [Marinomonas sp. IMCC 4694]
MTSDALSIKTIAFDADDTLWRNEDIFIHAQDAFIELLLPYQNEVFIRSHLGETQVKNLAHFGYGIKGFTLSMIETAIELTEGRISGSEIHQIIQLAKCMLASPVELLDQVEQVLKRLHGRFQLLVITKGDLLDQESKLARSGLADYFDVVEIVSDKTPETYRQILQRHGWKAEEFLMVGNSLKSDVLPVMDIGAKALHISYHSTWEHEQVSEEVLQSYPLLTRLKDISQLEGWLQQTSSR